MNLKNNFLIYSLIFFVLGFIFFSPLFALADDHGTVPAVSTTKIENPIKIDTVNGLVKTILEGIIKIGIPIIAIAIIYSGFLFITAQGKPDEIKKAKDALLYTVIGAGVLLGAWALAQVIAETVINIK